METLGDRLKSLRKEKGYTLEQVADKLNTTKVTISRYEKNLREPKKETKLELSSDRTALFDGEPMCQEAIDSLLAAMEIGLSLVKQKQKRDNNM